MSGINLTSAEQRIRHDIVSKWVKTQGVRQNEQTNGNEEITESGGVVNFGSAFTDAINENVNSDQEGLAKDLINSEEDLTEVIQMVWPTEVNEYPISVLLLILFIVLDQNYLDQMLHPKQWMAKPAVLEAWTSVMMISLEKWTEVLMTMRKAMKTSYANLRLQCLENLTTAFTAIFPPSLCLVELMEFRGVCQSWNTLLVNTPLRTGISLPATTTTSIYPTSVPTSPAPVVAHGCIEDFFISKTDSADFVGFLEGQTCDQLIGETVCDTYLRAAGSSSELVASTKMKDYVIDINIYRYALKLKILYYRNLYINGANDYINKITGVKLLRHINKLNEYDPEDQITILNIYNSNILDKIIALMHNDRLTLYSMFKMLCFTDERRLMTKSLNYDYVLDLIVRNFNEKNNDTITQCTKCMFYHKTHYNINNVLEFNNRYTLLTFRQCKRMLKSCIKF